MTITLDDEDLFFLATAGFGDPVVCSAEVNLEASALIPAKRKQFERRNAALNGESMMVAANGNC
jgi:hypothetical protein